MSEGWEVRKLGEICRFQGGSQPPKSTFIYEPKSGYVRFLQIRDFKSEKHVTFIPESPKNRHCESDDILLGRYGASVGHVLTGKTGAYNVAVIKTMPDEEILERRFFYFYLTSPEFQVPLANIGGRAAQAGFNKKDLAGFDVVVPPLAEQKKIVAILDEAFAAIATAKAAAEKNLANARELFESYLNRVFTQKGDGWVETPLGDLVDIKHGFAFKSKFFVDHSEYIVLTPGSFYEEGGFRDRGDKTKYYKGEIPEGFIHSKDDFVVAMTEQAAGLLGSSLIVPEDHRYLHNQRLGLVQPKSGVVWCNEFFHHAFNTRHFRSKVHASASGVKVRHTSPKKMYVISMLYPTAIEEQKATANKLDVALAESKRFETLYTQKLADLAELKQSLLQKAFTGQLTAKRAKLEVAV